MQGFPIGRWHLPARLWAGFFAGQAVAANSRRRFRIRVRSPSAPMPAGVRQGALGGATTRSAYRDRGCRVAPRSPHRRCAGSIAPARRGNHRQAAGRKLKSSLAPPAPGRRRARPWRPDSAAAGALLAGVAADRTLAAASGPFPLTPAHAIALRGCCKLCRKDRDRLSSHPVHGARQVS